MEKKICTRCGGTGYIPAYRHNGGECYKCGTLGYIVVDKNKQPTKRNNIEYAVFNNETEVVFIGKFEKPVNMTKAMQLADTLLPEGIRYTYMNLCTEEQVADLLKEVK